MTRALEANNTNDLTSLQAVGRNYWGDNNYWPTPIYPIYQQPTYVQPLTFQFTTSRCAWCQGTHVGTCDRLKSVSYRSDGTVERVEFFREGDKQ